MQDGLELVELLDRQLVALAQQMGRLLAPLQPQITQLDSIPGVDATAARAVLAEIGTDMSRFGADARLASWAGICPGNNESAGKRRRGQTRKGNRYLRRVLVQWAWAARKTPTYLGHTIRRLEARLGGKKAAVAVAHKSLVIVSHLLAEGTMYEETRYEHLQSSQEAQQRKRAVKALERLGYQVTLERMASSGVVPVSLRRGERGLSHTLTTMAHGLRGCGAPTQQEVFRGNVECYTYVPWFEDFSGFRGFENPLYFSQMTELRFPRQQRIDQRFFIRLTMPSFCFNVAWLLSKLGLTG
jgi:hypothetical protein